MKEQVEPSSLSFSDSILMQREQRRLTPSITIITFPRAFAKINYINQVRDVTRITQSVQICVTRYYCALSIKNKKEERINTFLLLLTRNKLAPSLPILESSIPFQSRSTLIGIYCLIFALFSFEMK